MTTTHAQDSRLRTPAAILAAAARLLAESEAASMADVAAAAGVGRATLYRYYPSREALVAALAAEAVQEAGTRLADAGLDTAPPEEAIERIVRALIAVGDRFAVLVTRECIELDPDAIERLISQPIRRVFQRAVDEGLLRDDLPLDIQLELFGGIVRTGITLAGERRLGLEDAAAAITSTFLDGARRR